MAILTRLKLANRRGSSTLVELDGEEWATLETEVVLVFRLACGLELDEEKCKEILDEDAFVRARRYTAILLQIRRRSVVEIERKLREKKYEPHVTERAVLYFSEKGALDDAEFARRFVARQFRTKMIGPRKVAALLYQKGVASHHVSAALAAEGGDDEQQEAAIRKIIERRLPRLQREDKYARRRKLSGVLARAGFAPGLYIPISREYLNPMELEDEKREREDGDDWMDNSDI